MTVTGGFWRPLDALVSVIGVVALVTLLGLVAGRVAGHQVLIDRSDSMQPAIATGDLLLTQKVRPASARIGDIVTFAEPGGTGRTITHRVVAVRPAGGRLAFVTRGDAQSQSERWTVERDGTIGRTLLVVPKAGYAVDWLGRPVVRLCFITMAALLLGAMLLRSVWSRDASASPAP